MNRQEMIDRVVKDVATWDQASLVYEAQARMRESMEDMDIATLIAYFEAQFPEG